MMKEVKFIRPTLVSGVSYKRGDVASFRSKTADAVVMRGDGVYVRETKIANIDVVTKESKNKQVNKELSFRDKARAALDSAGIKYDGRWGDSLLRKALKDNGLEV